MSHPSKTSLLREEAPPALHLTVRVRFGGVTARQLERLVLLT